MLSFPRWRFRCLAWAWEWIIQTNILEWDAYGIRRQQNLHQCMCWLWKQLFEIADGISYWGGYGIRRAISWFPAILVEWTHWIRNCRQICVDGWKCIPSPKNQKPPRIWLQQNDCSCSWSLLNDPCLGSQVPNLVNWVRSRFEFLIRWDKILGQPHQAASWVAHNFLGSHDENFQK